MKIVPSPLLLGLIAASTGLAVSTRAAQAQTILPQSSHSYTSVDPNGNLSRTTVQTPLANASSVAGLIAGQGVLGSRSTTTSSTTLSVGSGFGASSFGFSTNQPYGGYGQPYGGYGYGAPAYCPPGYAGYPTGYPAPGYGYPTYGYPNTNVNNYYLPQQPFTFQASPQFPSRYGYSVPPASVTVFPIGPTTYTAPPLYPTYPFPGGNAPAPYGGAPYGGAPYGGAPYGGAPYGGYGYGGYGYPRQTYPNYNGTTIYSTGNGGITTQSQSSGFSVNIGRGGISGGFGARNSNSSTSVIKR